LAEEPRAEEYRYADDDMQYIFFRSESQSGPARYDEEKARVGQEEHGDRVPSAQNDARTFFNQAAD